ncbi:2-dehydro-3-deoxyphosphogluconate aldolase/4-hydroxy-2-oxoglutarate aldolase [Bartonella vinsonii subsp. arupensis OK-94-513]|uniref:2-dehydro-3-deoxy-phosphogluconate aldolase n=2 Tax=Bartonella vinsonii subsp. arupensis TaxID=110578 RepID=J0ZEV0_BARVI|nr:bifunctional 4-hydroxy-2-oxoglutarate aldolase/2-dehydro-3-deoxy-phosphogluconate aldolase [Bartonella vinsonii]EJF86548.1 2-dehydro-3-deoxyphosphogluconate aldolase/4-hydroxy-2-oxoglutarate aldolase [Bartonella vinsonii subsp. arupensis OK-94-513]EJF97897.1 2-dehydro-3-deoxyphosphogluconate aldolase/4-hydroxy-2-oxoglutarate aldolase [Bartonella vinsonii subsp. arupensis Pm136co]
MYPKIDYLLSLLQRQAVIPVLHIDDLQNAVPLARALVKGGLKTIEITLRTPKACDAIKKIIQEVPEAIVGAGTILKWAHYEQAEHAGAKFIVSPGLSNDLISCAKNSEIPFLPGVMTPSELMQACDQGYSYLKLFPAEAAGGIAFLQALASPFPEIQFFPTGGITQKNAAQWLQLPNVFCVGGSWIAPPKLVAAGNWDAISTLAHTAAQLFSHRIKAHSTI